MDEDAKGGLAGSAALAALAALAAIGEIAAEVVHELRNELSIISANVYLAKLDGEGRAEALAKIERHTRSAQAIVEDLMALARGEGMHAEPLVLLEAIGAARASLPNAARASWVDRVEPSTKVRAHLGLLTRLFHVLYDNAIAVGAKTVETSAHASDGRMIVDVHDDGPGVPPALASTLFEPLVSGRAGGTGLGLALARRIAAAHGGSLVLVPSASGATFRVDLPALGS